MATEYSDEAKEAARVLHIEGASSREIKERLNSGKAGLPYLVDPSERTIDNWRRAWKDQGVLAGFAVRSGEEDAVEEAIYRQLLAFARKATHDLGQAEMEGTATTPMVMRVGGYLKIIDAVKYQRQLRTKAKAGKLTPAEGGHLGSASDSAKPESMLARMARERKAAEKEAESETGQ
jgi:transposase